MAGWQDLTPEQHMANTTGNWASLTPQQHLDSNPAVADALAKISSDDREKAAESKISMPMAIATKLSQGGTGGFSDEMSGVNSVLDSLQAPGDFSLKELGRRYSWDNIKTAYDQGRDKMRDQQQLASTAYPKTAMASEIAGAMVSPINKIMPGSAIKSGAILGGLNSLGNSDEKDVAGMVKDTAKGAGMGAAIGYGIDKIAVPIAKWGSGLFNDVKAAANVEGAGGFGGEPPPGAATQSQAAKASAETSGKMSSSIESGHMEMEQSGQTFEKVAPKSIEELRNWKPSAESSETVAAKRLKEIEEFAPELNVKPLKYHYDMLQDPKNMKKMKTEFENLPTADARTQAVYNQEMINDSGKQVKNLVQTISKDEAKPLSGAGQDLIQSAKDKYHGEKDELSPIFKEFKANSVDLTKDEVGEIVADLQKNTKIGKLIAVKPAIPATLETAEVPSKIVLKPFSTKIGVTEKDFSVANRIVKDLNSGASFEELQKMREYLRNKLNPLNYKETQGVEELRDALLDSVNKMIGKRGGNYQATAQRYAINEKNLANIEKIIGPISKLDETFAANPEKVVDKILGNPNYTNFVKNYLGQDAVDKMVSSYMTDGIKGCYDAVEGFQPFKLRNWLKSNDTFLNNYVDDVVVKKLHLYADYGYLGAKFLKEVNPSGTAASLLAALEPKSLVQKIKTDGVKAAVTHEFTNKVMATVEQKQAVNFMNKAMGKPVPPPSPSMMSKLPNITPQISKTDVLAGTITGVAASEKESKWADKGGKAILERDPEINQATIDALKKSKKGLNLLIQSSDFQKDSPALQKIIEQIKQSDEYKKSKELSKSEYPKKILKDGYSAIVKNKMEHDEAKKEGWT